MARAICISCGRSKSWHWKRCRYCGLDPLSDESLLVKSLYLSTGRFDEERTQKRYEKELDRIAKDIQEGKAVEFDSKEIDRLLTLKHQCDSVSVNVLIRTLWYLFLPGIVFLLFLYGAFSVLRLLHALL